MQILLFILFLQKFKHQTLNQFPKVHFVLRWVPRGVVNIKTSLVQTQPAIQIRNSLFYQRGVLFIRMPIYILGSKRTPTSVKLLK